MYSVSEVFFLTWPWHYRTVPEVSGYTLHPFGHTEVWWQRTLLSEVVNVSLCYTLKLLLRHRETQRRQEVLAAALLFVIPVFNYVTNKGFPLLTSIVLLYQLISWSRFCTHSVHEKENQIENRSDHFRNATSPLPISTPDSSGNAAPRSVRYMEPQIIGIQQELITENSLDEESIQSLENIPQRRSQRLRNGWNNFDDTSRDVGNDSSGPDSDEGTTYMLDLVTPPPKRFHGIEVAVGIPNPSGILCFANSVLVALANVKSFTDSVVEWNLKTVAAEKKQKNFPLTLTALLSALKPRSVDSDHRNISRLAREFYRAFEKAESDVGSRLLARPQQQEDAEDFRRQLLKIIDIRQPSSSQSMLSRDIYRSSLRTLSLSGPTRTLVKKLEKVPNDKLLETLDKMIQQERRKVVDGGAMDILCKLSWLRDNFGVPPSPARLFELQQITSEICPTCGRLQLEVTLVDHIEVCPPALKRRVCDLQATFLPESVDDSSTCVICGEEAVTSVTYRELPRLLLVHISRVDFVAGRSARLQGRVVLPMILEVETTKYSLLSLIVHHGSAEEGHYYSYVKTRQEKWFKF